MERADERVDLRPTDWVLPAFRLEVDRFEAEAVFMDQAVDALVGPSAGEPAGGVAPAAVAPGPHEVKDDLLEEGGRVVGDLVEQFGGERVVERFVGPFEDGLGCFGGRVGGGLG